MKTIGASGTSRGLLALLSVAASLACSAQTPNTWTGNGDDWNEAANWSDGLPVAGQDIVIDGDVTLTNATPRFASYTLNANWTHTFDGWDTVLNADAVTIKARATMTHAQNDAIITNSLGLWVPNARVNIECATLDIEANGKIDVNGKGYGGHKGVSTDGYGPGHGLGAGAGSGASYGGKGGVGTNQSGPLYGDPDIPLEPGSGGASGMLDHQGNPTNVGGNGGGAVHILATGQITVNGTITANGTGRVNHYSGGGSGGAVYLVCETITGNGSISADGEITGSQGGAGGGGRISIQYDPVAQEAIPLPALRFSAAGNGEYKFSEAGTLALPDNQFLLRQTGAVRHRGQWLPPFEKWERDELELNTAWLVFPHAGFELIVTNNLSIKGAQHYQQKLELSNAVVRCGGDLLVDKASLFLRSSENGGSELLCGGDMKVQNAAIIRVYSAATEDIKDYGALVQVVGDLTVSSTSWIYPHSHPTLGGAVQFKVGSLTLPTANAGFNATGLGYSGGQTTMTNGFGPGRGKGTTFAGGGGYGGFGGGGGGTDGYRNEGYCLTNGLACAPFGPGSGGGGGNNNNSPNIGGWGGGAIRIQATGAVVVHGSLLANGLAGGHHFSGGGSGGGIFIICKTFSGDGGILQANGNNFGSNGGGGGGGRIAVWQHVPEAFWPNYFAGRLGGATVTENPPETFVNGTLSVGVAASSHAPAPEAGTIVFLTAPPLGTLFMFK